MRLPLLIVAIFFAMPCAGETLRWSNQGNYLSIDPHAQNTVITNQLNAQVYERLILRDKQLRRVPGLASAWRRTSPTTWIFELRKGVKWHDGSDFTADDVVFSMLRAQGATSGFRAQAGMMGKPRRLDAHSVEFTTAEPNPVLPDAASNLPIMSKAWCEKHGATRVQDYRAKEETYASRNAMGTGPFVLVSHEHDVKSVFRRNPHWWGLREGLFEGNVTEVVFTPLTTDSTRMAALASGAIHFVLDPPPQDIAKVRQDPSLRVHEGPETSIFFIGMDQQRHELSSSSVKGRNPFKDVRVRRAIDRAIDMDAIARTALRGLALPTGVILPRPDASRVPKELLARAPVDVAAARALLAEAGYASGFSVTMDCDARLERVCTAVAAMLARIGITINLAVAQPSQFYQKIQRLDTSMYLSGWISALDPILTLHPLAHSRNDRGDGEWNLGNFRDERLDAMIDALRVEFDEARRHEMAVEIARLVREQAYLIALYRRVTPWASRRNIELVHRPDTWLEPRWVFIR